MRKLLFAIFFLTIPLAAADAALTTGSLIIRVQGAWGNTFNSDSLYWESDGNTSGTLYINGVAIGGAKGYAHRFFQHSDSTYIEQDLTSRSVRFVINDVTVGILTETSAFEYIGDITMKPFADAAVSSYITFDTDTDSFVFGLFTGSVIGKVATLSATNFQVNSIRLGFFRLFSMGYPTSYMDVTNDYLDIWEVTQIAKTNLE